MSHVARSVVVIGILLGAMAYAIAADLTLTTYYPTPYAAYRELQTLGDTFLATGAGTVGVGVMPPFVDSSRKLHVAGDTTIEGSIRIQIPSAAPNRILRSQDALGTGVWQDPPPDCFYGAPG